MRRIRQLMTVSWVTALLIVLVAAGCSTSSARSVAPVRSWLEHRPLYVAHRGGDGDWPEGSRYAYRRAADWSPRLALEVPVWRSADGVWVVSEDPTTGRVFGRDLAIAHTPWSALAGLRSRHGDQPMARLQQDVLDVVPRNRVIFVDDKAGADPAGLLDLLDRYGGRRRFVIKAYWSAESVVAAAHRRRYLTWGYYYSADLSGFDATESRFDLLGLEWSAPAAAFARLRSTGKPLIADVVGSAAEARRALRLGATGLMVSAVREVVPRH